MTKRTKNWKPSMRRHSSGKARVTIPGDKTYYLGEWESPESYAAYAELIGKWIANGRKPLTAAETVQQIEERRRRLADRLDISMAAAQLVESVQQETGLSTVEAVAVAKTRFPDAFAHEVPSAPPPSVKQAADAYETFLDNTTRYRKHGKCTTERAIIKKALAEFTDLCGSMPMPELAGGHLEKYKASLEARPDLHVGGINRKVATVRRALKWLRRNNDPTGKPWLTRDQFADIQEVETLKQSEAGDRPRKKPKRAVTAAEVELTAAHACPTIAAMMRLQLLTGARPGEVCRIRWQDIDKTPVVVANTTCWTWYVDGAKTAHHGHETSYPLTPAAQGILEAFNGLPTSYLFSPARAAAERSAAARAARTTKHTKQTEDRDRRQKRRTYRPCYDSASYGAAVGSAVQRAGVVPFTPHQIRHGYVTRAARRFGTLAAQSAANHTSSTTTAAYLHTDQLDKFRVALGLLEPAAG